ncbi:MAG: hypothetical protein ACPGD8_06870 [Flavobacteriales bacterium]
MAKTANGNKAIGILAILLTIYIAFFFAKPINLSTADLGRHIVNGELVLNGSWDVLYSNHFSFTEQSHEFINHHWGTGIVFYLVHEIAGFKGLSALYVLLTILAFLFMGLAARVKNHVAVVSLSIIAIVPLVAYRVEVRPEGISYALLAGYYLLFAKFRAQQISIKKLAIPLLILQVLWVNMHIFFFLGIIVAGAFWLESVVQKKTESKQLLMLVSGLILVSLVNPHLHKGLLAPLSIFTEYGYMVAENQTLFFMHDRFANPEFYHFELFGILTLFLIGYLFVKGFWKQHLPEILLGLTFLILATVAVRGIPLFAFFFIPLVSAVLNHWIEGFNYKAKDATLKYLPYLGIAFLVIFIPLKGTYASARKGYEKLGLIEGINGCGEFIRSNKIPGKIFNNYDLGGYLIYHLHDKEKVFVDNRPEAYSVAFFDSIYKPMQENEVIWKQKSEEYGINLIVFYRHDNTPWAQPFLIGKAQDPEWVPIYVDQVSLILIKNREENRQWIEEFALPRKMFNGVPNN